VGNAKPLTTMSSILTAGAFALYMMDRWPSCWRYYLVDIWAQQKNYEDLANVDDDAQEGLYSTTMKNLEHHT
jgi:hypothetical protein